MILPVCNQIETSNAKVTASKVTDSPAYQAVIEASKKLMAATLAEIIKDSSHKTIVVVAAAGYEGELAKVDGQVLRRLHRNEFPFMNRVASLLPPGRLDAVEFYRGHHAVRYRTTAGVVGPGQSSVSDYFRSSTGRAPAPPPPPAADPHHPTVAVVAGEIKKRVTDTRRR